MRHIVVTRRFARDAKRVKKALKPEPSDWGTLEYALGILQAGESLPKGFRDHPLKFELAGYREFHLDSDWLVIYKVFDDRVVLHRTGTHLALFHRWRTRPEGRRRKSR